MDLVLFGIQGSGKGTQGKFIISEFDFESFETGGILREMIKKADSQTGKVLDEISKKDLEKAKEIKEIITAGHLVPNEIVIEIVEDFINKIPEGKPALFDGLPRKEVQAKSFNALMKKNGREFKAVIIDISKEEAMKRLTTRRICSECKEVYPSMFGKDTCEKCGGKLITRKDDNPESIENRLNAYFQETMPVIEAYEKEGKLIRVNGEQSIEEVTKELFEKIAPYV